MKKTRGVTFRPSLAHHHTSKERTPPIPLLATHTSTHENKTQHIECVTALREERCVWVWVVGDGTCAVLGRSHYRHPRATGDGMEWDGIGWGVCVRDRERPDAGER